MKEYKTEHLPVILEFIVMGVCLSLSNLYNTTSDFNYFMEIVNKRCLKQGLDKKDIEAALSPIKYSIESIIKDKEI